jgi:hypothetical protein
VSRLERDPQVEALVAAYRADLEAAGMFAENEVTSPARSFLLRVGVDGFSAMTLDQQLAVSGHDRRLAAWLIVTGRVRPTAEYLVASKLRVGKVAAGVYREFHGRFLGVAAGRSVRPDGSGSLLAAKFPACRAKWVRRRVHPRTRPNVKAGSHGRLRIRLCGWRASAIRLA